MERSVCYNKISRRILTVSIIGIIFSSIFLIDGFMPADRTEAKVLRTISYGRGKGGSSRQHGVVTAHGKMVVSAAFYADIIEGDFFEFDRTRFFGLTKRFYLRGKEYSIANVYALHKVPLILLLILSFACGLLRNQDSAATYFSAALAVVLLIMLFFLLMDGVYIEDV